MSAPSSASFRLRTVYAVRAIAPSRTRFVEMAHFFDAADARAYIAARYPAGSSDAYSFPLVVDVARPVVA